MKEIIILLLIFFNAYGMTLLDKDLSSHVSITGLASIDRVIGYSCRKNRFEHCGETIFSLRGSSKSYWVEMDLSSYLNKKAYLKSRRLTLYITPEDNLRDSVYVQIIKRGDSVIYGNSKWLSFDDFLWVIYFTLIWFVLLMDKYFGKPLRASKA
ncbi:hypothetical protein PE36_08611 [Moritella sp. PE36]|uniref:hypothetical protein n=1 Tax=Moritella sp. PE36 TaxID=58051 RepID=UPI00015683A7|nr:hypothetical protein [Moritella sp. PE36]EDM67079.1 hypothetical protein PE36_08611 [Moritella sp. PE36]